MNLAYNLKNLYIAMLSNRYPLRKVVIENGVVKVYNGIWNWGDFGREDYGSIITKFHIEGEGLFNPGRYT